MSKLAIMIIRMQTNHLCMIIGYKVHSAVSHRAIVITSPTSLSLSLSLSVVNFRASQESSFSLALATL